MTRLSTLTVALAVLLPASALAQGFGPRPGPSMGGQEKKPETPTGPAEAAPEEKEGEPEIPPLPAWPGQETRKLQFFQMRGYFRFRWNLDHGVALGQIGPYPTFGSGNPVGPTIYNPVSEYPGANLSCANRLTTPPPGGGTRDLAADDCPGTTIGGADMRLRLEPTINVSESIRIHAQLDLFDNLVLGSTPRSLSGTQTVPDVPLSVFSGTQEPPVVGQNSNRPSIVVKRAWAEVDLPVTTLRVGRMPTHWGMGISDNDGNCPNCDRGDSQDRIMLTASLANHTFAMGYDFTATGPTTFTVGESKNYYWGQPLDLEKLDDVHELFWVAGRIDPEEVIQDRRERGELVLNYGLYLRWRKQDFDYKTGLGFGSDVNGALGLAANMIERDAWMLIPDLWFKLLWKKLSLEFEGVLIGGSIANAATPAVNEVTTVKPIDILEYGWAFRSEYRFLHDSLKVGLDMGMASGDDDEPANGDVFRDNWNPIAVNRGGWMTEFRFNYDYQVDLILFRQVLGTVANATYFKPHISYDIVESFGARFDLIYSLANKPVGFPGNSTNLGLEMDLDIYYKNVDEGFYASLAYGVLFPFGALDRPVEIYPTSPLDAGAAHTLQGRIFIQF